MPSPPEARIDVTAIEHSFNDPARSVELVSEVLESALDALANALLPDAAMALPEFSSVTRTNWRGPNEIIGAVIEGFKREADALTIELGTLVEAQLRRARLDLAALFGRTGTPLPLQDLKGRSEIPIDLAQLADMDSANALVRVVEMPEGLPGAVVDNGWTVVTGQDRRRIKMVQDYRCFSARAVLDLPREEWQQALKLEHVLYETSTQPLHDAVKERRIVPRICGELVQASRAR